METVLFVDDANKRTCALLAGARSSFDNSKDNGKTFPLFQLPRELRLQIYEHILVNDPPTIGHHHHLYHNFLHEKLAVIWEDLLDSVFFYTAPLIVDPDYDPDEASYIWPFDYVDCRDPNSQGHRVRLQLTPEETDKCAHLSCVLRWFRCQSFWEPPSRTLRRYRYTRDRMGVPRENVSIVPTSEPFIDTERLEVIYAGLVFMVVAELAPIRRFLFSDLRRFFTVDLRKFLTVGLRRFLTAVFQPIHHFLLGGGWMVPLDWYYHYAMAQKRRDGRMGIVNASLQFSTVAMMVLIAPACLVVNSLYCWDPVVYDELREDLGAVSVTAIIALFMVWARTI